MEEEVVKKQGKNTFIDVTRLGITLALMLAIGFAGGLTVAASGTGKAFSRIPLLGDGLDTGRVSGSCRFLEDVECARC